MENPVSRQEETELQHQAEMPFDPHSDCSLHTPATGSWRVGWLGVHIHPLLLLLSLLPPTLLPKCTSLKAISSS